MDSKVVEEKQIDEMARVIAKFNCNKKGCDDCDFWGFDCDDWQHYTIMAEALYNAGYRKIPEDSVVLTREAYEKFLKVNSELAVLEKSISSLQGEANDYKQRYESAEKRCEQLVQSGCEALKQKRKETAEKIIKDLWDNKFETTITIQHNSSKEDIENVGKAIITTIRNKLEELAKQFGVEIKE